MTKYLALAALALAGCASNPNVDLSKVETVCGQKCASDYSTCSGKFSLTPIYTQSSCSEGLRVCAQACPPR